MLPAASFACRQDSQQPPPVAAPLHLPQPKLAQVLVLLLLQHPVLLLLQHPALLHQEML
jgi:hypothetical protein